MSLTTSTGAGILSPEEVSALVVQPLIAESGAMRLHGRADGRAQPARATCHRRSDCSMDSRGC
jgi:hypothetical protein